MTVKEISMRKLVFTISMLGAMMFALAVNAAAPANFAGTWTLDKAKSQGLAGRMQSAESVKWVVTQDAKQISIDQQVTGGEAPAGGGGGRGMGGPQGPRSYNLDGSETNVEMGQGKATRKATWSNDGATLELTTKSTFTGPNGEVTSTSTDKLQLSGDGKVLTVNTHRESPRGAQDSTLVFNK
jgi:hypothetical protein